ncbi:MAG: ABC transporter ATP-binding protein [Paenibacillaceae bacterium]
MSQIELRNVSLSYFTSKSETKALRDIHLSVKDEEFISLVGPSGCGKSTLLSLISGMIKPTKGEVLLFGEALHSASPRVGYMLQHDYLFEWRDILSNVMVGAEIRRMDLKQAKQRAIDLLDHYGLADFAYYNPNQLSGGMRQRVALIRTLMTDPDILLLDEPFSSIDYQTRLSLQDEFSSIIRSQGKTAILVTHDISEAIAMADRVCVMSPRPSTITTIHDIHFATLLRPTPLLSRQEPEYNSYFNTIWKEMKGSGAIHKE